MHSLFIGLGCTKILGFVIGATELIHPMFMDLLNSTLGTMAGIPPYPCCCEVVTDVADKLPGNAKFGCAVHVTICDVPVIMF